MNSWPCSLVDESNNCETIGVSEMHERGWRGNGPQGDGKYDDDSDVESINCCQLEVHKAKIRESRAQYHNHPEKRLFQRRSCTDVLCLLFFVGCLVGWIYIGYYAIISTPPEAILAPTDSYNRRCGFDDGVKNKPNVFYFDLLKCVPPRASVFQCNTPRVCVSECPKDNFYLKAFLDTSSIQVIKSKLICRESFDKASIRNKESALKAVTNNDCAEWYLESKPIYKRCVYDRSEMYDRDVVNKYLQESTANLSSLSELRVKSEVILSCALCYLTHHRTILEPKSLRNTADDVVIGFETFGKRIESTINGVTGKELFDASKAMADIFEFGDAVFQDLQVIWPWILVHFCVGAVVSFLYITIMRWISGLMIWLSIFACIALLVYSSYYTFDKFREISEYENADASYKSPNSHYSVLELLWKKETWLGFFIVSVAFLLIILITIIFLRSRISLAVELIKEGSKAVTSSWSAVIFPIFPWVLQLAIIGYAVVVFAYLLNFSGTPVRKAVGLDGSPECVCKNGYREGSVCQEDIFASQCYSVVTNGPCETAHCLLTETPIQKQVVYLQLYNLLMFLWSLFFASGFGQLVLASTFATYYWTFNKDDLPVFMVASSVWRVLRYHLGTVSLGSFLLALCNWIRVLIELWYNYLNKYDNCFVKVLRCCCACFFWCLNAFLKFLNKNAYIMCAIHGKNFCTSARLVFNLLVRNILRVTILDRVTNFLLFLGKLMVTTALGILAFHFFSHPVPPLEDPFKGQGYVVEYYFVPMVIICVVTYFIASLFFGVYSMAVDTLFLCALEDLETNDGSPEKPYFMSKNLMKILKKKNEIKVK